MTGRLGETSVCATYPSDSRDSQIVVTVNHKKTMVLQMNADLRWRELAFAAAAFTAENFPPDSAVDPRI